MENTIVKTTKTTVIWTKAFRDGINWIAAMILPFQEEERTATVTHGPGTENPRTGFFPEPYATVPPQNEKNRAASFAAARILHRDNGD